MTNFHMFKKLEEKCQVETWKILKRHKTSRYENNNVRNETCPK